MSVYKVIDLIGTSPKGWEAAAAEAVLRAKESVNDVRVAEVVEQDMYIKDDGGIIYRTKLRVSFKVGSRSASDEDE